MVNSGRTAAPLSLYYDQPKSLVEQMYLVIYRFVLGRADLIIFNSEWLRDLYCKTFSLSAKKIAIITNPVTTMVPSTVIPDVAANDEIIFAGRFIPIKNLIRLIEAFKRLPGATRLRLIGDGPQRQALADVALGDRRISIESPRSQQGIWEAMNRARGVVVPSLSEVSPNVAAEALSLGVPVVLTRYNGLAPTLQQRCVLVDPESVDSIYDGLTQLLVLAASRRQSMEADFSNQHIATSWNTIVQQHRELID
jgi:glycosyltransferase involved in cell wall biosynthesis